MKKSKVVAPSGAKKQPRTGSGRKSISKTGASRVGISSASFPAGSARFSAGGRANSIRVSGREYIGVITMPTVTGDNVANTILFSRPNLAGPTNTRLAQFASIFERWHAKQYSYRVTSCLPSVSGGTYIMGQEPDAATDYITGATSNVARLRTLTGSTMLQAWQSGVCHLAPTGDYTSLWCYDPSVVVTEADRLDLAGRFFVAIVAPFTGIVAGSGIAIVELDYDIEFYSPRLSEFAAERSTQASTPSSVPTGSPPFPGTAASGNGIVQDAVEFLSKVNLATPSALAGVAAAVANYRKYPSVPAVVAPLLGASVPKCDPPAGWTTGDYVVNIGFGSNDPYWATHDPIFYPAQTAAAISTWDRGTNYTAGQVSTLVTGHSNKSTAVTGPDGEVYGYYFQSNFEFGVAGDRGFLDREYSVDGGTTILHGGNWFVTVDVAGTPTYSVLDLVSGKPVKRAKARVKRVESKDEEKKAMIPSPSVPHSETARPAMVNCLDEDDYVDARRVDRSRPSGTPLSAALRR